MSFFESIKEYFKQKKMQAENRAEQKKNKEMLNRDIKTANKLLQSFAFRINAKSRSGYKKEVDRIIDEHNLEYFFIPDVWNMLNMPMKMAVMVKFSEKHNKYHLKLEDFFVPSDKLKKSPRMMHLKRTPNGYGVAIDYDKKKMSNSIYVLSALLSYEDMIKETKFIENFICYESILDFKSIDELKYMIDGREYLFASYFPEANKSNQKFLMNAIEQYKVNIDEIATKRAVDLMSNSLFYADEAQDAVKFFEKYIDSINHVKDEIVKRAFGSMENLKKKTIEMAYDLIEKPKDPSQRVSYEKAMEHFMSMEEKSQDGSLFPYIDMPARDKEYELVSD